MSFLIPLQLKNGIHPGLGKLCIPPLHFGMLCLIFSLPYSMKELETFIPSFINLQLLQLAVVYSEFQMQPNRKISCGGS